MAVFFLDGDFGPIAFNAAGAAPTEMYLYIERFGVWAGKQRLFGFDKAGTLTDGPVTDGIQAKTTDPDLSSAALEYDDDADSPYKGDLRLMMTMS